MQVIYSETNETFFVMTDYKIQIWNKDFKINLHSLKSSVEFVYMYLNEDFQKLMIYTKSK